MKYHVEVGGENFEVERLASGVRMGAWEPEAELTRLGAGELQLVLDGANHRVFARRTGEGWRLTIRGRTFDVAVEDERTRAIHKLTGRSGGEGGPREMRAPMAGLVVRVLVEPGEHVEPGDPLVVIEAMKMENELRAEGPGTVGEIAVRPGDIVDRDQRLVTLATESA
ncbi:acetyl-CoA carboxylase biotin carboxyl carrier protein subunit [Candidatus Palauibacter sp.]|uniref:acetyl-CoA carboxylase biotin carboxyl carrier protein subunit n=1 Tax=Candidatus Palauibacter sp. TaxID=3101350 RepID=UPI003AF2639C